MLKHCAKQQNYKRRRTAAQKTASQRLLGQNALAILGEQREPSVA